MAQEHIDSETGLYVRSGQAWLTCPRLIALDARHGQDPRTWRASWRLQQIPKVDPLTKLPVLDPLTRAINLIPNPDYLVDPEGHTSNRFVYVPGCRPPTQEEMGFCGCGRALVWSDGDPI